jgi:hypothetical protein
VGKSEFKGSITGHRFDEEVGWNENVGWIAMNTTGTINRQGIPLIEVIANGALVGRFPADKLYELASLVVRVAESDV